MVDSKLRSFVESDYGAAVFDELLKRIDSCLPESTADLCRITIFRQAVENLLRGLSRDDYAVEFRS